MLWIWLERFSFVVLLLPFLSFFRVVLRLRISCETFEWVPHTFFRRVCRRPVRTNSAPHLQFFAISLKKGSVKPSWLRTSLRNSEILCSRGRYNALRDCASLASSVRWNFFFPSTRRTVTTKVIPVVSLFRHLSDRFLATEWMTRFPQIPKPFLTWHQTFSWKKSRSQLSSNLFHFFRIISLHEIT